MIIATVAMKPEATLHASINKCEQTVKKIIAEHSCTTLIFFGELCLSPYIISPEALDPYAIQINDDNFNMIKRIATNNRIYLSLGLVEKCGDQLYNAQILISPSGEVVNTHRKFNLTAKERLYFKRGTSPLSITKLNEFKVGTTICYDMFSATFQKHAKVYRPDIILHSLADPQDADFTIGLAGRITRAWYVASNRYGIEGEQYFNGHIGIVSPMGRIVSIKSHLESVIVYDIQKHNTAGFLISLALTVKMAFHIVKHFSKVMAYIKWDLKMKKAKTLQ